MPTSMKHVLRTAMLLPLLLAFTGCAPLGPPTVSRDRFEYTNAVAESWKRQMLLNILKIRYGDAPIFLDVTSIINQYSLETELRGTLGWSNPPIADRQELAGTGRYYSVCFCCLLFLWGGCVWCCVLCMLRGGGGGLVWVVLVCSGWVVFGLFVVGLVFCFVGVGVFLVGCFGCVFFFVVGGVLGLGVGVLLCFWFGGFLGGVRGAGVFFLVLVVFFFPRPPWGSFFFFLVVRVFVFAGGACFGAFFFGPGWVPGLFPGGGVVVLFFWGCCLVLPGCPAAVPVGCCFFFFLGFFFFPGGFV
ncbi:MAG: hypothetical protein IPN00_02940 [Hydrogenophilales bacterium]|nr:hypothetical protein [Hydrogenophilales bacterium]